jgi:hypothetical protein
VLILLMMITIEFQEDIIWVFVSNQNIIKVFYDRVFITSATNWYGKSTLYSYRVLNLWYGQGCCIGVGSMLD